MTREAYQTTRVKCAYALIACIFSLLTASCGSAGNTSTNSGSNGAGGTSTAQIPSVQHIVVVALENADYESVVGSLNAPYLNSLIPQGGLATNYYANTHPSIGNYFVLTTGQTITNDDS